MWIQDVRHAIRMMKRAPGFTAAAVATLSLGLGLNSAVLGLADALFRRRWDISASGSKTRRIRCRAIPARKCACWVTLPR